MCCVLMQASVNGGDGDWEYEEVVLERVRSFTLQSTHCWPSCCVRSELKDYRMPIVCFCLLYRAVEVWALASQEAGTCHILALTQVSTLPRSLMVALLPEMAALGTVFYFNCLTIK
jgi:hypothetical protein